MVKTYENKVYNILLEFHIKTYIDAVLIVMRKENHYLISEFPNKIIFPANKLFSVDIFIYYYIFIYHRSNLFIIHREKVRFTLDKL